MDKGPNPSLFCIGMTILKQIDENESNDNQYKKGDCGQFCEQAKPKWHLSFLPKPLTYLD